MGKRSSVEPAQRMEAVLGLLRKEEPAARIARRFGVSEPTLYRWRDEFLEAGKAALASKKSGDSADRQRVRELEREVERRDQVIGELTIANRILKKLEAHPS